MKLAGVRLEDAEHEVGWGQINLSCAQEKVSYNSFPFKCRNIFNEIKRFQKDLKWS